MGENGERNYKNFQIVWLKTEAGQWNNNGQYFFNMGEMTECLHIYGNDLASSEKKLMMQR